MNVRSDLPQHLDVDVRVARGQAVVHARGHVDVESAPVLRAALADGQARRHRDGLRPPLAVDLSGVTFLDASGLGVLIGGVRRARRLGTDLVLRNPTARTLRVLEMTRLIDVVRVERAPDRPWLLSPAHRSTFRARHVA
jgi:anti-anti-sigma factor